ncbi:MAG TPA: bifunctional oligoribonuclease/PAP phosphatase NrnA [Synergistaceae bacterium]|nr:bifunctional oligoribonuclease/PAP phosphatase NrnA [Synergistaceae bacterium]NLL41673.1 bifunctional oligoribonuclease/PAP phosphatase NrnA [Synergistaceae bacterium]HPX02917.1 bifunctional oligoribonuclease/PAP phosphatase NrnA [Synergistaceae bacterium]HQA54154.1 bifunctional oligoribonuclease/PAP phosphatase NrnA [Synergistaceae bacterium]
MDNTAMKVIVEKLGSAAKWVILCHENPDGDTIGCGLALYSLGKRLGKNVRIMGRDPIPARYCFLPYYNDFECCMEIREEDVKDALLVCVDTSTVARSMPGLNEILSFADSINIDHHGDNHRYCRLNLVDPDASASAEIITDLLTEGGWGIEKSEAICLYTGLSTDNGNFRFGTTTARSHLCAAKLLEAGVEPAVIDGYVNENMTPEILKLWGVAYTRTEIFSNGKGALFWLGKEDFASASADSSAVDGLVNVLLRITGVKVALFLTEINGENKVSIRTKPPYSARDIASAFGGGGHLQAAGAKPGGSFIDAVNAVKAEAEKYINDRASAAE